MRHWLIGSAVALLVSTTLATISTHASSSFAAPAFGQQWRQGEALAPNFWGPLSTAHDDQQEPYTEAPGGQRLVQYFDKGRMELTNGTVTNGLLATDLVKGQIQVGDATIQSKPAPAISIAGDPDNPGPTYAGLSSKAASLFAPTASKPGTFVTLIAAADGAVSDGGGFAGISMSPAISGYDATTQHNVLGAFAGYRNNVGLPSIGLAISEPFRANVKVAGASVTVLVQIFERRILTYTASNDPAFQVEMGNIGQHYYQWRYGGGSQGGVLPALSPTGTAILSAAPGTWTKAASMAVPRSEHRAVLLKDGTVLVIGDSQAAGMERYDPVRDVWSAVPAPPTDHGEGFVAAPLTDGHVLLVGGQGAVCHDSGRCFIGFNTAAIYDPTANTWTAATPMHAGRHDFTATVLPNGKVLVIGGSSAGGSDSIYSPLASAERYDPATNTWTPVANLATARYGHAAALLGDGTVLVAGGITAHGFASNPTILASAERYNPATDSWSDAGTMTTALGRFAYFDLTAIRLGDGQVLIAGGTTIERYDPTTNAWAAAATALTPRSQYTATLLPNGKVLVAGGTVITPGHSQEQPVADAALYDPTADAWSVTGNMATARYLHTATLLANGQVMVAGGDTNNFTDPTAFAERYIP